VIYELILYGRAKYNGNLVDFDFWVIHPYDIHGELYRGLTFGRADIAQTKVHIYFHHQSRTWVSGWTYIHGFDETLNWWYSTVTI